MIKLKQKQEALKAQRDREFQGFWNIHQVLTAQSHVLKSIKKKHKEMTPEEFSKELLEIESYINDSKRTLIKNFLGEEAIDTWMDKNYI